MTNLDDIPAVLARIQKAVDTRDAVGFAAGWTADAVLNLTFADGQTMRLESRDTILGLAAAGWKGEGSPMRHLVGTVAVEALGPNEARARHYSLYVTPGQRPAAPGVGFYDDLLVFEDGAWRVSERQHLFFNPIHIGGDHD